MCLDSFHILSRGHDPAQIEQIPGEKIFFLQLADAPALTMDVLSWSRHHRLFPGEGAFDLPHFVGHALAAGYRGPISLEVFNDTFRQTDVLRTAQQAKRSLTWLEDQVARLPLEASRPDRPSRLPDVEQPTDFDFVEVKAEDAGDVDVMLRQLGFTFRGHHRSKPVRLWTQGRARVVCNEQQARDWVPTLAAVGFEVADPAASADRARRLDAPAVYRRTLATEEDLAAFRAPDGTEVFLGRCRRRRHATGCRSSRAERTTSTTASSHESTTSTSPIRGRPSTRPSCFTAASSRWSPAASQDVAAPSGLVRSQVVRSHDGAVRLALNVAPMAFDRPHGFPQHVAFSSPDVMAVARAARDRGLGLAADPGELLRRPGCPVDLPTDVVGEMQELGVLYDRDDHGDFTHFYTATVGSVFFEVVQRRGGYDGYGATNAPVRLAAQHAPDARD